MNQLIVICFAVIALAVLALIVSEWSHGFLPHRGRARLPRTIRLANLGVAEHPTGNITKYVDAAFATRYLLAKVGSDAAHVAICTDGDKPLGIVTDEAAAAEDLVNVAILGSTTGTKTMTASDTIAAGAKVYTEDGGKVQPQPTVAGTYYLVGEAKTAAATDGDLFEVTPCIPIKVVVLAELTAPDTAVGSDAGTTQTLANALQADLIALEAVLTGEPTLIILLNS